MKVKISRAFVLFGGVMVMLFLTACPNNSGGGTARVNSVTVTTPNGAEVAIGNTLQLAASVDATGSISRDVTWSSGNEAVATVNGSGLVMGESAGSATIIATSQADSSKSDSVEITVTGSSTNRRPTADAGLDQNVVASRTETVTLDGSGSSDPDSDTLSYSWAITAKPDGSAATLAGAGSATPSFTADLAGDYSFELTVSDGALEAKDIVIVAATCPEPIVIGGDIGADATWGPNIANCSDYIVEGRGFLDENVVLTIQPGTHVVFRSSGGLYAFGSGSAINAVGTAEQPITFVGENDLPGSWKGLGFQSTNPLNELTHVIIDGGGGAEFDFAYKTNVFMKEDAHLTLTNSVVRNSGGYGLYVTNTAGDLSGFANNVFSGNASAPLHLPSNQLGYLDTESDYDGTADHPNGEAFLEVAGSATTTDQTWPKINLPYRMGPRNGHDITGAHVTIEPGAVFEFESGVELTVYNGGALTAVGTATEPIIFRGFQEGQGVWDGILFSSSDVRNELNHVVVDGAGAGGLGPSGIDANVGIRQDARAKLSNSTFSDSGGFGIYLENNAAVEPADPESAEASNTFENNALGAVGP